MYTKHLHNIIYYFPYHSVFHLVTTTTTESSPLPMPRKKALAKRRKAGVSELLFFYINEINVHAYNDHLS